MARQLPLLGLVTLLAIGCNRDEGPPAPAPAPAIKQGRIAHNLDDFADICRGNEPPTGGMAYEKAAGKASKLVVLESHGDKSSYLVKTPTPLDPWKADKPEDAQLIVCVTVKDSNKAHECRFDQRKPARYLELHDATYAVSIHDAATGKKHVDTTISKKAATSCPMIHVCAGNRESSYPKIATEITALVKPLQPKDAPPLKVTEELLRGVCSGEAASGAAAYDKGKGPLVIFYRKADSATFDAVFYSKALSERREAWRQAAKAERSGTDFAKYPLVACITSKPQPHKKRCAFQGGKTLEVQAAKYSVDVFEAKTGKKLASRVLSALPRTCPLVHDFAKGDTDLADPGKPLARFLEGFASK